MIPYELYGTNLLLLLLLYIKLTVYISRADLIINDNVLLYECMCTTLVLN